MAAITNDSKPVGYIELIRNNRNFRLAWAGQVISLTGDWFDLIASATLLGRLNTSAFSIGLLFVVRMLAPFFVSPLAGPLVDRFNRKYLLIASDAIRAFIVLLFLFVQKPGDEWLLYLATGLQLTLSGIYFPARTAILPDICKPNEVGTANAISATTWSVMLAVGAAIGGPAVSLFDVYPSFVVDSLTFGASALLQAFIHYDFVPAADAVKISIQSTIQQYVEGLRFLRHQADLFMIAIQKGLMAMIIIGAFQVIMVTISKQNFVIGTDGTTGLGIMYGMVGLGTGVSPIVMRRFTGDRNRPMRLSIILGYLVASIAMFVMMPLLTFEMTLVGMFLRGFGLAIIWVFTTQLLLQLTPARVRGRVFATEFAIQSLGAAAGSFIGGLASDVLDMRSVIMWMGIIILIPGALWVLWIWLGKTLETQVADNSMLIPRTPAEKVNQVPAANK